MLKLEPLTNCSKTEFDKIRAAKNNPHKKNLENLSKAIYQRYDLYSYHFQNNSFEKIPKVKYANTDSLKSCYNSSTDALDELRVAIRNKQLPISKRICQYCGINTDDQIDHYLPKEDFVDFNVHSLNMIPCCARCNQKKGRYWLDKKTNEKGIINLYRDELVRDQYLFLKIKFNDGIFTGKYYLDNPNKIHANVYDQICNHFNKLDLIERYNDLLSGIFDNEQRIIDSMKLSFNDALIKKSFIKLYKSDSKALGVNNFRVVARKAIAEKYPF